jgi:hypothetical protein
MTRRLRACALLVILAATLAGCGALKMTYNRLDWVAAWQVGRFVDLEPPQRDLFDESFREFWRWHRGTQLGLYVSDIRALATAIDRPLTPARVEEYLDRSQDHLARTLQELVPDTARVLRSFDDDQIAELTENLAERRRERAEESGNMSAEELREDAEERMVRNLKKWTGPLTREQKQRIKRWAGERVYAGSVWQQYQEAWASSFTDALAHRNEPAFEQRLSALFADAQVPYREDMRKVQAHNRQAWITVMADLSGMLTPEQRRHAQARLRELAADLEELARQPPPEAALPRIIG